MIFSADFYVALIAVPIWVGSWGLLSSIHNMVNTVSGNESKSVLNICVWVFDACLTYNCALEIAN